MNTGNLKFLLDSLRFLGFGTNGILQDQLKAFVQKGDKDFQLSAAYNYEGVVRMEADLFFRRPDNSEIYFFNKYHARLVYADHPTMEREQVFYISKGRGFTRKEAFNLLQGRSVNKDLYKQDGSKYNAWVQLNFDEKIPTSNNYTTLRFGANYGFDLENELEKYQIREMDYAPLRSSLLQSLRKGNLHSVTFSRDQDAKALIEANPRFKSINIYHQLPPGHIAVDVDSPRLEPIPANGEGEGEIEGPFWGDAEESEPEESGAGESESMEVGDLSLTRARVRTRKPRKKIA